MNSTSFSLARLLLPSLLVTFSLLTTTRLAAVEMISVTNAPRGVNIALRANGGRFDLASPAGEDKFTPNVNDGYSTEWRAKAKIFPQDIVLSFFGSRTARLDRVVINTHTKEIVEKPERCPREIEIAVSLESPTTGFRPLVTTELERRPGRQLISFDATAARYLRVRFKSSYAEPVQFAEIEAYEAPGQPSILEGQLFNLAAAGNGGAVVRFNEPSSDAAWLLDGLNRGWHTDSNTRQADLVFAFRGDQEALIDHIVLDPRSNHPGNTMARSGKIFLSRSTPLEGFEEAGDFVIEKDGKEVSIPIHRKARFVKIAITGNHGGNNTSLGEVHMFEGAADGYHSILNRTKSESAAAAAPPLESETEYEPNNSAERANLLFLEAPLRGQIKPLGDEDFFTLEIEKPKFPEVSIELRGRPYIRTSLTLSQDGKDLAHYDPTNATGERAIIKFPVAAGGYGIRVYEPPTSLLLVYDASSSMKESMNDLRVAVDGYVDQLRPSVLVNLVRFDSKQEVLLPEFTSDQAKLKEIIAQKFGLGMGTAFYDAVDAGFALLKDRPGNRAMILMTDGADSSSKANYIGFWKQVEAQNIRIYTVAFGYEMDLLADKMGTTPRRMLGHIALASRGRSFMSDNAGELKNLYEGIGEEISLVSDYSLTAFWGEEPPTPEAVSSAFTRKKNLGRTSAVTRYFLVGLGGLVLVGLLVVLWIAARDRRNKKNIPRNQYRK